MSKKANPPDHRRKWNLEEYGKLAKERQQDDDIKTKPDVPVKRELLKARNYKVNFDAMIGKSQIVTKTNTTSQVGGYYCEVCECNIKDNIAYLDHINGKSHQRNMGMSMKVERSTLEQVKKRFEMNKKKKEEQAKSQDEKVMEDVKLKTQRNDEKMKRKRSAPSDDDEEKDKGMGGLMGFSSFGSSKKPK